MDHTVSELRHRPAAGRVVRVNGPLVEVEGLGDVAMSELVQLGRHQLPGEVVSIRGGRVAVGSLREDPATRTRLEAVVRRRLGDPDATVVPPPDGGLVGETADGRRVDASVAALVDAALAETDLEQLWTTR